jgi:hypothetical protein
MEQTEMRNMSLAELEHKLEGHIYKGHLMLALKHAILNFKPLAAVLLGPLTGDSPAAMAEAEVLFIQGKGECPSNLKKRMSRVDEFGILDLSFMEATKFLRAVREDQAYARNVVENGVVIYTKDEGTWRYVCEMASILGHSHQEQDG